MSPKRALYDILGVAPDAADDEISRVYRRLALQYHPDRNPNGEAKFKEVANAYAVLSDPDKRRVYDATGIVPGAESATESEATMAERSAEMKERVHEFYVNYAGTPEEIEDVMTCFKKCKGNFRRMVREELLFDNTKKGEIVRLRDLVQSLVDTGKLQSTEAWNLTNTVAVLKQIERSMTKERKEAAEALDAMGLSNDEKKGGLQALQALMKRDQEAEWSNMMSNLESKYLQPKAKKSKETSGNKKKKNTKEVLKGKENTSKMAKKRKGEKTNLTSAPPLKKQRK
ncbi:putative chaperone DNAJ protein [Trypanosoma theileri]|uniref:Putative chaperone DNAJ protein n=1 Tax=Trypanosoma theileri TaxID=67003 RepID=A0A1X0P0E8_9TRYP|nr:putative chaperone DNAJ protein [Trypanosoma theileri]ORC90385.1 putative chaperone DNAJ protein [Trypanosoma theileri]